MNLTQRIIIAGGIILFVLTLLFPPSTYGVLHFFTFYQTHGDLFDGGRYVMLLFGEIIVAGGVCGICATRFLVPTWLQRGVLGVAVCVVLLVTLWPWNAEYGTHRLILFTGDGNSSGGPGVEAGDWVAAVLLTFVYTTLLLFATSPRTSPGSRRAIVWSILGFTLILLLLTLPTFLLMYPE
ncbi:MAG: hypothetical protein ACYDBB_18795 [Armatimonadota bacterium]